MGLQAVGNTHCAQNARWLYIQSKPHYNEARCNEGGLYNTDRPFLTMTQACSPTDVIAYTEVDLYIVWTIMFPNDSLIVLRLTCTTLTETFLKYNKNNNKTHNPNTSATYLSSLTNLRLGFGVLQFLLGMWEVDMSEWFRAIRFRRSRSRNRTRYLPIHDSFTPETSQGKCWLSVDLSMTNACSVKITNIIR